MFVKHMRLGRDPEMKTTQKGTKVVNISAVYDTYVNGENVPTWVNISLFDKQAEFLTKYGKKGYVFKFSGDIWLNEFERQDGTKGKGLNMVADSVKFSEVRTGSQNNSNSNSGSNNNSSSNQSNNSYNNQTSSNSYEPSEAVSEGESIFEEFFNEGEGA